VSVKKARPKMVDNVVWLRYPYYQELTYRQPGNESMDIAYSDYQKLWDNFINVLRDVRGMRAQFNFGRPSTAASTVVEKRYEELWTQIEDVVTELSQNQYVKAKNEAAHVYTAEYCDSLLSMVFDGRK
jgi:hypothetical protein